MIRFSILALICLALALAAVACSDDDAVPSGSSSNANLSSLSSSAASQSAGSASSAAASSSSTASSAAASSLSADAGGPVMVSSASTCSINASQAVVCYTYDKDCTVYVVVQPAAQSAPTTVAAMIASASDTNANVTANSMNGSTVYGSYSGEYTIYLLAIDSGDKHSALTAVSFEIDAIAPVNTLLAVTNISSTGATIIFRYDESCSEIATLIQPAGVAAPTSFMDFDAAPLKYWLRSTPKNTIYSNAFTDLTPATDYKAYSLAGDDTYHESVVSSVSFSTP